MPHQCVSCGALFKDGSKDILTGCTKCGGKLFFFISKAKLEKLEKEKDAQKIDLSEKDKVQIEKDVRELVGDKISVDEPVVLDIESIRI